MPENENAAEAAGRITLEAVFDCLATERSFRLEAGAGAGKTHSLDEALRHLIATRGDELLRAGRRVGCITYTNAAKNELSARILAHPAVHLETIHAFCWSLLNRFQAALRQHVSALDDWPELAALGDVGRRRIQYEKGFRGIKADEVRLGHDDVLVLMCRLLALPKFQAVVTARYPIILIDEYQDTDAGFVDTVKRVFLETRSGPLFGFFGDHWQKIYGDGCGRVDHGQLCVIEKNANFRSAAPIVNLLNRMRPELTQAASDPEVPGEARVFHTNAWGGQRRAAGPGGHWKGDTTPDAAAAYLSLVKTRLAAEGWDLSAPATKILMLSHRAIALEAGYPTIQEIYGGFNDPWLKKEDPHIKFLTDNLEPACAAFQARRYGEMFEAFGVGMPRIRTHADKLAWTATFTDLIGLRATGSIGEVIDRIGQEPHMRLPDAVREAERQLAGVEADSGEEEPRRVTQLRRLRAVPYNELIAVDRMVDGHTPFSTKHGVKGAEFENVLVVIGRGWNRYDFGQMIEMTVNGPPTARQTFFEDNRNLFYVACSRPRRRLAVLFTQLLSEDALAQLGRWFDGQIVALPADPRA